MRHAVAGELLPAVRCSRAERKLSANQRRQLNRPNSGRIAGQALDNDAQNAALDLPPIDASDYTSAMADFQVSGTDFATGIQSSTEAGETPLKNASREFQSFAASVKATCN